MQHVAFHTVHACFKTIETFRIKIDEAIGRKFCIVGFEFGGAR